MTAGSSMTMPRFFTYIIIFDVPKSTAMSVPSQRAGDRYRSGDMRLFLVLFVNPDSDNVCTQPL